MPQILQHTSLPEHLRVRLNKNGQTADQILASTQLSTRNTLALESGHEKRRIR